MCVFRSPMWLQGLLEAKDVVSSVCFCGFFLKSNLCWTLPAMIPAADPLCASSCRDHHGSLCGGTSARLQPEICRSGAHPQWPGSFVHLTESPTQGYPCPFIIITQNEELSPDGNIFHSVLHPWLLNLCLEGLLFQTLGHWPEPLPRPHPVIYPGGLRPGCLTQEGQTYTASLSTVPSTSTDPPNTKSPPWKQTKTDLKSPRLSESFGGNLGAPLTSLGADSCMF